MSRISLTSIGFKVLSTLCSLGMLILTYAVTFLVNEGNIVAILFSSFVTVFCLFTMYLSFNHSICLKDKTLILKEIKTYLIKIEDINCIHINDDSLLNENTIFIETSHKIYKLNGFNSLLKHNNTLRTRNIVLKLCENLNLQYQENRQKLIKR